MENPNFSAQPETENQWAFRGCTQGCRGGVGSGGELGQFEDGRLDRGLFVVAVDLVHVGVGVSDDHHAHVLRDVLAPYSVP